MFFPIQKTMSLSFPIETDASGKPLAHLSNFLCVLRVLLWPAAAVASRSSDRVGGGSEKYFNSLPTMKVSRLWTCPSKGVESTTVVRTS